MPPSDKSSNKTRISAPWRFHREATHGKKRDAAHVDREDYTNKANISTPGTGKKKDTGQIVGGGGQLDRSAEVKPNQLNSNAVVLKSRVHHEPWFLRTFYDVNYFPLPDPTDADIYAPISPLTNEYRWNNLKNTEIGLDNTEVAKEALKMTEAQQLYRPDPQTIQLRGNYFPLQIEAIRYHKYSAQISFAKPLSDSGDSGDQPMISKRMKSKILQLAEASKDWEELGLKGNTVHDNWSTIISLTQLSVTTIDIPFHEADDGRNSLKRSGFKLTLVPIESVHPGTLKSKLTGKSPLKPSDINSALRDLDIIISASVRNGDQGRIVAIGGNSLFFPGDPPYNPADLGEGLQAWWGVHSSTQVFQRDLMVNLDVCTSVFHKEVPLRSLRVNEWSEGRLAGFVKGLRVRIQDNGHGRVATIRNVYRKSTNVTFIRPERIGNHSNSADVKVEAQECHVLPDQPFWAQLTGEQKRKLIDLATQEPARKAKSIAENCYSRMGFKEQPENKLLKQFGLAVSSDMAIVSGQVLPPPRVKYGRRVVSIGRDARWDPLVFNTSFSAAKAITKWGVVIISDGNDNPMEGIKDLVNRVRSVVHQTVVWAFSRMGMMVDGHPDIIVARLPPREPQNDPLRKKAINIIDATLSRLRHEISFVLFVLANDDRDIYSGLKYMYEIKLPILMTCIQTKKLLDVLETEDRKYALGLAMKINLKLGGWNQDVICPMIHTLRQSATLIIGLTLHNPGSQSGPWTPAIASVVANVDVNFAQFPARLSLQHQRLKVIINVQNLVFSRITAYKDKVGNWPEHIIIYHYNNKRQDAIPDLTPRTSELEDAKAAIRQVGELRKQAYSPKLSYIYSYRQHQSKFFPTSSISAHGLGNPPPGTLVYEGVGLSDLCVFFLQAHEAHNGTARPIYYQVLHDDANFASGQWHMLTHSLCYMVGKIAHATSLPAPIYYSNLAGKRGLCYLYPYVKGTPSAAGSDIINEFWQGGPNPQIRDSMYYI